MIATRRLRPKVEAMVTPLVARIESYCGIRGIEIPEGFYRHPASRFVVIRLDSSPPKLVARTWSSVTDVIYYLSRLLAAELSIPADALPVRILDFKELLELTYTGGTRLSRNGPIEGLV